MTAVLAPDCPEFKLIDFNPRRHSRGAEAARVAVDSEWLWMSKKDVEKNIAAFGPHPELVKAREAYKRPGQEIRDGVKL